MEQETCYNCEKPVSEEDIEGYHIFDNAPLCKECAKEIGVIVVDDGDTFPYADMSMR